MCDPTTHLLPETTTAHGGATAISVGGVTVITIETPTLGDRSYLVHDGHVGFVVDPQRDIDRITAVLEAEQIELTHVFETHIHNDYVTGGFALAQATGAAYLVNGADDVSFDRTPISDGDLIAVGSTMLVRAMATPGHTFTHLSYLLSSLEADGEKSVGVFSGGSLLIGATGRPDLLGPEYAEELAHHQHASAHRLAAELPDSASVFPTHGFGSFCSATQSDSSESTIGAERETNPVLTSDADRYVADLLAGLGAYPAYYSRMAPMNSAGPTAAAFTVPIEVDADELRSRITRGEWVVDLRTRTAFAAGHTPGALNFGLDGGFVTYLGWLIPWTEAGQMPLTFLANDPSDIVTAQRELARIGIETINGQATGSPADWVADGDALATYPTATFADLAAVRHHRTVTVVDVRRAEEYDASHISGAINLPLGELGQRSEELLALLAGELWVHCAGGYRASIAASMFLRAGLASDLGPIALVAIDDAFANAGAAGLI